MVPIEVIASKSLQHGMLTHIFGKDFLSNPVLDAIFLQKEKGSWHIRPLILLGQVHSYGVKLIGTRTTCVL
jgi:hypothetical protein